MAGSSRCLPRIVPSKPNPPCCRRAPRALTLLARPLPASTAHLATLPRLELAAAAPGELDLHPCACHPCPGLRLAFATCCMHCRAALQRPPRAACFPFSQRPLTALMYTTNRLTLRWILLPPCPALPVPLLQQDWLLRSRRQVCYLQELPQGLPVFHPRPKVRSLPASLPASRPASQPAADARGCLLPAHMCQAAKASRECCIARHQCLAAHLSPCSLPCPAPPCAPQEAATVPTRHV